MPVAADTHAVMDNLIDTIGKRDVKMQGSLTVAERTALKLKNKPAQRRSIELEGQNFDGREWSKTQRTKRLLSVGGLNKSYHFESGTAWIDVLLDTRKMSAASSKRGGEQSQGAVMANTSATRVSILTSVVNDCDSLVANWNADSRIVGVGNNPHCDRLLLQ